MSLFCDHLKDDQLKTGRKSDYLGTSGLHSLGNIASKANIIKVYSNHHARCLHYKTYIRITEMILYGIFHIILRISQNVGRIAGGKFFESS